MWCNYSAPAFLERPEVSRARPDGQVSLSRGDPEAVYLLADVHFRQGERLRAISVIENAGVGSGCVVRKSAIPGLRLSNR